jgi:inhibitor of KinA sporulation pathway (predicted exonuclease)
VGTATLDRKRLAIKDKTSFLIKPVVSKVSSFCTSLTTITQDMVEKGALFGEVCSALQRTKNSKNIPWASYGDYDRNMFDRQCKRTGVEYPFSNRHINIKLLAAVTFGWDKEVGMNYALDRLGLQLDGTHHRGADDAFNIAKILIKILDNGKKIR